MDEAEQTKLGEFRDKPWIAKVTRRQFLALTAVSAGACGLGILVSRPSQNSRSAAGVDAVKKSFVLPKAPSLNPGYQVQPVADGGLLLWSTMPGEKFKGYRLNQMGRTVWDLCDGVRNQDQIATEYGTLTGRIRAEAKDFLVELMKTGVVVAGGRVVATSGFPLPYKGRAYHIRLNGKGKEAEG